MKTDENLYALILAGGAGTRFWPKSRQCNPKQFLDIVGVNNLFVQTVSRINKKIAVKNIFIVANKDFKSQVKKYISKFKIPMANVLLEPSAKNTAASICFGVAHINSINKNAVVGVFPSDHLISKEKKFISVLSKAYLLAKDNHLVTFGITPSRPETGYGYLKVKKQKIKGKDILKVKEFTEKPSVKKAKAFIKSKNYLWNGGIFVWKASVILDEFKTYLPTTLKTIGLNPTNVSVSKSWKKLKKVSIDYGILEKAKNIVAVNTGDIGWSDLGSWEALADISSKDKNGNIFNSNVVSINCKNTYVSVSDKKLVATIGIEDLVIIDTKDALLVCPKNKSQEVKDMVSALNKGGKKSYL
ncbi:MAG: sugar phosphate nucleotidyltransferase [Candidatus Zapsychrus exili]|nr:sugar phosphate nucleotidyltransferase [Candidatus Zapsychrus exili]